MLLVPLRRERQLGERALRALRRHARHAAGNLLHPQVDGRAALAPPLRARGGAQAAQPSVGVRRLGVLEALRLEQNI